MSRRIVPGNGPVTLHRTRVGPAHYNDPDAAQDVARGHARTLRYSPRGGRLWRRPGPKVRTPRGEKKSSKAPRTSLHTHI